MKCYSRMVQLATSTYSLFVSISASAKTREIVGCLLAGITVGDERQICVVEGRYINRARPTVTGTYGVVLPELPRVCRQERRRADLDLVPRGAMTGVLSLVSLFYYTLLDSQVIHSRRCCNL